MILLFFILLAILLVFLYKKPHNAPPVYTGVHYVALGDSYTIGEGATIETSWPSVLVKHLQQEGIKIKLIANPSVTGWTTEQVIDNELPIYEVSEPTFATLQIGVNDWVQGVSIETFHEHLVTILDRMQAVLPVKNHLILITIPDFSVTPTGAGYSGGRDIAKGIAVFNTVITNEGIKRGLPVVDIFPLSQSMKHDPTLIAPDGLHPSAREYALWEKVIYPVVFKQLQ